jgi:hypothetical protein
MTRSTIVALFRRGSRTQANRRGFQTRHQPGSNFRPEITASPTLKPSEVQIIKNRKTKEFQAPKLVLSLLSILFLYVNER